MAVNKPSLWAVPSDKAHLQSHNHGNCAITITFILPRGIFHRVTTYIAMLDYSNSTIQMEEVAKSAGLSLLLCVYSPLFNVSIQMHI